MGERVMKDRAKEAGTSCFLRFSCRQKTKGCACGSKKAAPMRRKDKPRGAALRSSAPHTGQAGRKEGRGEWTGMGGLRAAHKNMRPAGRFTAPWDAADIGLLRSLRGLPVIRVVLI